MNIDEVKEGDHIRLVVDGKIDKLASHKFQTSVITALAKNMNLIIDFNRVVYISSAGLRALLVGQKTATVKKISMKITGVNSEVKSVLSMTGFDKVLTIEES